MLSKQSITSFSFLGSPSVCSKLCFCLSLQQSHKESCLVLHQLSKLSASLSYSSKFLMDTSFVAWPDIEYNRATSSLLSLIVSPCNSGMYAVLVARLNFLCVSITRIIIWFTHWSIGQAVSQGFTACLFTRVCLLVSDHSSSSVTDQSRASHKLFCLYASLIPAASHWSPSSRFHAYWICSWICSAGTHVMCNCCFHCGVLD